MSDRSAFNDRSFANISARHEVDTQPVIERETNRTETGETGRSSLRVQAGRHLHRGRPARPAPHPASNAGTDQPGLFDTASGPVDDPTHGGRQ